MAEEKALARVDRSNESLERRFLPRSFSDLMTMAKYLANSQLVPSAYRGKPDDVAAAVLAGAEVGVPPMSALRNIFMVDGKPSFSAALTSGIVLQHPDCVYFRLVESTDKKATYETLRVGMEEPVTMSFTMEQAEQAGLTGKKNWKMYPAAMLRARCEVALGRVVYPDRLAGIYLPEELGSDSMGDVIDAEIVETREPEAPGEEDFPEIETPKAKEPEPEPKEEGPATEEKTKEPGALLDDGQLDTIRQLCDEHGIAKTALDDWCREAFEVGIKEVGADKHQLICDFIEVGQATADQKKRVAKQMTAKEMKPEDVEAYSVAIFGCRVKHLSKRQITQLVGWIVEQGE